MFDDDDRIAPVGGIEAALAAGRDRDRAREE